MHCAEKQLNKTMCSEKQFAELAIAMNMSPLSNALIMSNGYQVGWRSNRRTYVSAIAYKTATGKNIREKDG